MIEHLVLFKFNDGVSSEQKQEMLAGLRALPAKIPEIDYLACGEDFSGRSKGFHVGLVVRFQNREALDIYAPHPAHQEFIERFRHLWEEVMACDFETT